MEIIDEPINPKKLVLLVDIANIRPRGEGQVRKLFKTFSKRSSESKSPTSLNFIDRCISDLEVEAPGAIIIKFADRALFESLPMEDRNEFFRRSELSFEEPEKIVLVSTVQADVPLIEAANTLQASIISQDNFDQPHLQAMMANDFAIFKFHFDSSQSQFSFRQKNGVRLSDWWLENVGVLSDHWYQGTQRLDVEYELRKTVRELTFEFHSEPLTFTPEVPDHALEELDRLAREREAQRALIESRHKEARSFDHPEQTIFADEFDLLVNSIGKVVLLIGRFRASENAQWIEWFPGYQPISIVGPELDSAESDGRFVSVTGRLGMDNGSLALQLDPNQNFDFRKFDDVIRARPVYLKGEGSVEVEKPEPWALPSFSNALNLLTWIRKQAVDRNSASRQTIEIAAPGSSEINIEDEISSQVNQVGGEVDPDSSAAVIQPRHDQESPSDVLPPKVSASTSTIVHSPEVPAKPKQIETGVPTHPKFDSDSRPGPLVGAQKISPQEQAPRAEGRQHGSYPRRPSLRTVVAGLLVVVALALAALLFSRGSTSTGTPDQQFPFRYYELRSTAMYQEISLGWKSSRDAP